MLVKGSLSVYDWSPLLLSICNTTPLRSLLHTLQPLQQPTPNIIPITAANTSMVQNSQATIWQPHPEYLLCPSISGRFLSWYSQSQLTHCEVKGL